MSLDVIQSMWIGKHGVPLTTMEQLCMKSFMANGHEFHLYLYNPIGGVPNGVVLKDAREIVPQTIVKCFNYLAQFSDLFRYTLVLKKGGWWVDTDFVCLRPYDFAADLVIVGEGEFSNGVRGGGIHNAPFKSTAGHPYFKRVVELAEAKAPTWGSMEWGGIGGCLMTQAAVELGIQPINQFTFDHTQCSALYEDFIKANPPALPEEAYSVHLHHACWMGLAGQPYLDPDGKYPESSIYEQLKKRYL